HRGALASFHRKPLPDLDEVLHTALRVVVLEDLVSHTNLGAVFRCAAALGMDGLVLSPSCADPLYRRSVRVSMGAVFTLPYPRAESWPGVLDDMASALTRVALTPAADGIELDEMRSRSGERMAVLFGSEGPGLTKEALARSDVRVRVPMSGGVDCLSVATSAGVGFYVLGRA